MKKFENLFVRNGTELSVGINIRPSILDLEEEIAHHVKYQTCHFFRNSKFSFFYHLFSNFHEQSSKLKAKSLLTDVGQGRTFLWADSDYQSFRTIRFSSTLSFLIWLFFEFITGCHYYNWLILKVISHFYHTDTQKYHFFSSSSRVVSCWAD